MFRAVDSFIHAPAQLPLAPRPIPTELLSSWLLRVASANVISLQELLAGLRSRYGPVFTNVPMDYGVPEAAVVALARFCRVPPKTIRALDLCQQVPGLTSSMFLRFPCCDFFRPHRFLLGYAFCPSCIAAQQVIHVPWEWSLACLAQCPVHRQSLLNGCPACGEPDPLEFTATSNSALCRSCAIRLVATDMGVDNSGASDINAVQEDYRAALLGVPSALLPNTTAKAFRVFFEEIFRLLTSSLNYPVRKKHADLLSRQDVLAVIAALVLNAAPNPNHAIRRLRTTRSVRMWGTLLSVTPAYDGPTIERSSIHWPAELRRRFLSALRDRKRKRWPYTPYQAPSYAGKPVERSALAVEFSLARSLPSSVWDLSAIDPPPSGI